MITAIFNLTWDHAVFLSIKLLSIGSVIQALEFLLTSRHAVLGGLNDWSTLRTMQRTTLEAPLRYITDILFSNSSFIALNFIQLSGALATLIIPYPTITKWLLLIMIVCRLLLTLRKRIDHSAADQTQVMIFIGCAIYHFSEDSLVKTASVWLACLEIILFYVAAGVFKITAPLWRNRSALKNLLRTEAYSTMAAYRITRRYPWLIEVATWGTIIFECGLPFCVFVGPIPCLVFITCGVTFHAINTFIMGLNDFLWVFPATYPLLVCFSIDFQQRLLAILNT